MWHLGSGFSSPLSPLVLTRRWWPLTFLSLLLLLCCCCYFQPPGRWVTEELKMSGAALVAIAASIGNLLQGWDNATIADWLFGGLCTSIVDVEAGF
uniref:Uncharacterized protein n=1 Tax=Oryza punctata TaxID=4537 RepID=A0A0E0JXN4_ORYPU